MAVKNTYLSLGLNLLYAYSSLYLLTENVLKEKIGNRQACNKEVHLMLFLTMVNIVAIVLQYSVNQN